MNWRDYLCDLLGCKADCSQCKDALTECQQHNENLHFHLQNAQERIRQLELLVPRPPPPEITNIIEKDTYWVQGVIAKLKADIVRLPLGIEFRLTDKNTFIDFIAWNWVDSYEYHKFYRCGNFSIAFKADADKWGVNQVGIVLDYESSHAYNLVIFPDGKVMLIEPQSDNLFYWQEHAPQFYNLKGAAVII